MSDSSVKRTSNPGITAEERFVYEIILVCLIIMLTSLHQLRKIRGIQGTKEKTISELSSFLRARRAANRPSSRLKA
jgi:hypothetical protein